MDDGVKAVEIWIVIACGVSMIACSSRSGTHAPPPPADAEVFGYPPSGVGGPCAGFAGQACVKGLVCDYCDCPGTVIDGGGVCVVEPERCPDADAPVRACGKTYRNDCERLLAHVPRGTPGACHGASRRASSASSAAMR